MRPLLILAIGVVFVFNLAASSQARERRLLSAGWRFTLDDVQGAEKAGFDDQGWQTVSLPHNWGWQEAQQGKPILRGPGWYRRELDLKMETGKRFFLRFEAASLVADVYLNGKFV